jgi:inward rectifier potassium channel
MADFRSFRDRSRISDPGFGEKFGSRTKRVINKDGSFNIHLEGLEGGVRSVYQSLLGMSTFAFILGVLLGYIIISFIFSLIYYFIGVENLTQVHGKTEMTKYLDCFFFSTQTFTTVGYGAIAPKGIWMSITASLQAWMGLIYFSLATGLMYARFARPKAQLLYSRNALISPYKEGRALMFRLANERSNVLMQMEGRVILAMRDTEVVGYNRRFFELKLEVEKVLFLALSWTVVHEINETSPLYGLTEKDLADRGVEILILITGYDDTFNQIVHSRYSYTHDEFVWDAKFLSAFHSDDVGNVVMRLHDIHAYERLNQSN